MSNLFPVENNEISKSEKFLLLKFVENDSNLFVLHRGGSVDGALFSFLSVTIPLCSDKLQKAFA